MVRASAKCMGVFYKFLHLPSYGEIAKIILYDLDLHLKGHNL